MLNAWTGVLQQTKLTAFRQISLALVLNVTIDFKCNCPKENYFITFYVEYPVSISTVQLLTTNPWCQTNVIHWKISCLTTDQLIDYESSVVHEVPKEQRLINICQL